MGFHPDAPIKSSDEDRLKRTRFSDGIAESILGYNPTDSAVIGLIGPWGSGKTSVINMVVERLRKDKEAAMPLVVPFNPWRHSGSEHLLSTFFTTLAKAIGQYESLPVLKDAAKKMDQAAAALGVFGNVPHIGGIFSSLSKFVKFGASNVQDVIRQAGALDTLHDQLVESLRQARRRIIVIMDDLDRLAPDEILQMFRLVKSLADFPYVMYLLAFDRDIVLAAIDKNRDTAANYLEKIITLPLDMPPAGQAILDDMVIGELTELFRVDRPAFYNEERFFRQYADGFRKYFRTMRDVRRYLNIFSFTYGRLKSEVDGGDLATLTALQVFEPQLYSKIHDEASTFVDIDEAVWRRDREKPLENRKRVEAALDSLALRNREVAIETLRLLFHKIDLAFQGSQYSLSGSRDAKEHRLASPEDFPNFFALEIVATRLSPSEREQALQLASSDQVEMARLMQSLGFEKTNSFVESIIADNEIVTHAASELSHIAGSLFALDAVYPTGHWYVGPLPLAFDWRIGHAVDHLLSRLDDQQLVEALGEAVRTSGDGFAAALSHVDRISRLRQKGEDSRLSALSDAQIESLKNDALEQVRHAFELGKLDNGQSLARILLRLQEWGLKDLCDQILARVRANPNMLVGLLRSARRTYGFEGVLQPKPMRFDLETLDKFIRLDDMRKLLEQANVVDQEDQRAIDGFLQQSAPGFDEHADDD